MNKKYVKSMCTVLIMSLLLSSMSFFTLAAGPSNNVTDTEKAMSLDEQLKEVLNSTALTGKQKNAAIEKINAAKKMNSSKSFFDDEKQQKSAQMNSAAGTYSSALSSGVSTPFAYRVNNYEIKVPCYKQETRYWCGPATVKQTLQYLKGSSPSQSALAKALGTTTSGTSIYAIRKYLNNHQNKNTYVQMTPSSNNAMQNAMLMAVKTYKAPPILLVRITNKNFGGKAEYTSDGHYLNVSGVYHVYATPSSGCTVNYRLVDPYKQWKNQKSTGIYQVAALEAYEAVRAHRLQSFLY